MKKKKFELITWLLFIISAIALYFVATNFAVFPVKYKFPLLAILIVLICLSGIISILVKRKTKWLAIGINSILIICVLAGLIMLPSLERRIRNIFKDTDTDEAVINVYVLNDKYKDDFGKYSNSRFIIQNTTDKDNQNYAVDEIKNILNSSILSVRKEDIFSAVEALYNGEGDLLILNEIYVNTIEDIEKFKNFSDDTEIVYTVKREIEIEKPEVIEIPKEITERTFTIYIAGEDTRSGRLSIYGRTDVDILLTINPVTKQAMITGIPRDSYIPNPALNYGNDKLTHLGNDGIQNTTKGVSEYFDIDIDYYGVVNFWTFKSIVDALGGVDVDNPYYFVSTSGYGDTNTYYFEEGTIHLNGNAALAYVRERYNLSNGDYGRSEHQTIVLKAIIQKLLSPSIIESYSEILDALQGQFLTDMDVEDIYKLIAMQLDNNVKWDIITYHLGGTGDMQGTASMGWNWKLYVVHLFDSQVKYIREEIEKMKNDEKIIQEALPNEGDTTYIPN